MYTQLVTGDVPGASTYFNPLLNQTVIPCTSGTRPSSPTDGMLIYETDTDKYVNYDAGAPGWVNFGCSRRLTWTPQLTATTTNPTLGTGAVQQGWYTYRPGNSLTCTFNIIFGSSGVNAGSGQYLISLPVSSSSLFGSASAPGMGIALIRDNSTSATISAAAYVPGGNVSVIALLMTGTGGGSVTNTAPWTWAAGDSLNGTIEFPF